MNYRQLFTKRKQAEERLKKLCPHITNDSGLYFYTRTEDDKIYAYIGKAKHLIDRNVDHLLGYKQRIDISIKKRGFLKENGTGWLFYVRFVPEWKLDDEEQKTIKTYQNMGVELYNIESGGTVGKTLINERKPAKTYKDGIEQGKKMIIKELQKMFEKNLIVGINGKSNKNKEKSLEKFKNFLKK